MISVNAHTAAKIGTTSHVPFKYKMGCKLTVRDKLLQHRQRSCPGNIYHDVPNRDKIFDNWHGRSNKAYTMYWRSHPEAFKAMQEKARAE